MASGSGQCGHDQQRSRPILHRPPIFMPDAPRVHVVITSRSPTAQDMTQLKAVKVAEMELSKATELFKRSAKMTKVESDEISEVDRIVKELGYLTLAITLAGSYVSAMPRLSSNIRRYLPECRQGRKEILQQRPKRYIHQYEKSIKST